MRYQAQLNTSKWLQRKYDILYRDNFVCSNCLADNSESRLEVHHLAYIRHAKAWEYPDYLLVTLCRECHQKEHDNKNTKKPKKIIEWIIKLVTPKPKKL